VPASPSQPIAGFEPRDQVYRCWRNAQEPEIEKLSLDTKSKTWQGDSLLDRDTEFTHIDASINRAPADQQLVLSVNTKRRLMGSFKNAGRELCPRSDPQEARVHDFLIKDLCRPMPSGIYDLAVIGGWIRVGIDPDTAEFAQQTMH